MPAKAHEPFPSASIRELAGDHRGAIKIGPFGSQLRKEEMVKEGRKVYGQENVIAEDWTLGDRRVRDSKFHALSSCLLEPGDVVITMMGTIGKCSVFPETGEPGLMDSHLLRIQPHPSRVDRDFLRTVLRAEQVVGRQVARMSHGSIMSGLSSSIVQKLRVPVPPLPEQRQIAAILDTVDDAIRTTEQIIDKLKQVKQGLLHDLLTRGIDDSGELRDPERHPEQFKDSPLGRIPRGWEVADLGTLAEVRSGIAKNSNRAVRDAISVHYLRVANVQDGFLDLTDMSTLLVAKDDVDRYRVLPRDVLMNEGGDLDKLGRGTLWRGELEPCVHQNHVFVVRCGARMAPEFLNAWTGSTPARRYFMVAGKQTTNLASINKTALGRLPVVVPQRAEQTEAVALLTAAHDRMAAEQTLLRKLSLMKAGLMEDLLTGHVRVTKLQETAAE